MACFLVTHEVTPAFDPEQLLACEKQVIGHLPREIKWVMSWHLPAQNLLLTHWQAPTEQAVRVAIERSGLCGPLPILRIDPALELYPKRYVARRAAAHLRAPAHPAAHKRPAHGPREMSGAYAESIHSVLQARSAEHQGVRVPR